MATNLISILAQFVPERVEFTVYGCGAKHLWEGGRGSISLLMARKMVTTVPRFLAAGVMQRKQSPRKRSNSKLKFYSRIIIFGILTSESIQKLFSFLWSRIWLESGEEVKSSKLFFRVCSKCFVKELPPLSILYTKGYIAN